jgi:preprotein translocase subunit SecF
MKVIGFMSRRKLAAAFSVALVLLSILGSLAVKQLNWGLDFTGGTLVEVHYGESANLNAIREALQTSGYEGAVVVSFGSDQDVLIRLPKGYSDAEGAAMLTMLRESLRDQRGAAAQRVRRPPGRR